MGYGEAGFQSVVAVEHHKGNLILYPGDLGGLQLLNLHVVGVLHNVLDGGSQTCAVGQLEDAVVLKQQQCPGFVGGVVGHGDDIAVGQVAQSGLGARIDAEGLIVDTGHGNQIGALFLIEIVQIGDMLEVVGVDLTAVYHQVGLDIVLKLGDLQLPALLGENLRGLGQNLRMGGGGGGNGDGALRLYGFGSGVSFGTGDNAALNHQGVLVILAVGVEQGCLIVGVEEVLGAQGLDFVIQPVQQRGVALGDGGSDGVRTAQRGNAHGVAGILDGEGNDLGVVVGPGYAVAVFKSGLGLGVGVILLQLDFRVVLFQIGLGGGAGDDDDLVIGTDLIQRSDHRVFRGDNAQSHIHIRKGEVHFLSPLGGDGEVCQNDVHLTGLQILDPVGGLGGDVVDLHAQILADPVAEVHVIALILAVLVHIAEGALVGEYADVDGAAGLDLVQGAEAALVLSGG